MALRALIDVLVAREQIDRVVLWYYTPAALVFTSHLEPLAVAYDCMDELAAFRGRCRGAARARSEDIDVR